MVNKRVFAALGAIAAITALGYLIYRKRVLYAYRSNGMGLFAVPYHGAYADYPAIDAFYRQLPKLFDNANAEIQRRTGVPPPQVPVRIGLSDDFASDTYHLPTAKTTCPARPYMPGKGNCRTYSITIGAKALADNFRGRTTVKKLITHEMTHIWMMYYLPNFMQLPDYVQECVPIDVAGQSDELVRAESTPKDASQTFAYPTGSIPVETYGKLWKKYKRSGITPASIFK